MDGDITELLTRIADDVRHLVQLAQLVVTNTHQGAIQQVDLRSRYALNVKEAAAVLGLPVATVRNLVDKNELYTVPLHGRHSVIPCWAIEQWVNGIHPTAATAPLATPRSEP